MTSPRKTLPPIGITNNNTPIAPTGNQNGTCCGKCGCAGKKAKAQNAPKSFREWWRALLVR